MKIIGIVAEYNPFHNGHMYQLQKSIQETHADGVIAIMSGNFVQRGHPAFFDKWLRTKMALSCGVNVVIELPTYYATSSAEQFAYGAISLLDRTNVVNHLCFGTENMNKYAFEQIARVLADEPNDYREALGEALSRGSSYPSAREEALRRCLPIADIPNAPNSILGIEYYKALYQQKSPIVPHLIKRTGSGYNDESMNSPLASATAIRKAYFEESPSFDFAPFIPSSCLQLIDAETPQGISIQAFESILLYLLRSQNAQSLSIYREVTEGLEHKLVKAAKYCATYEDLVNAIKSKRYTSTKISRMLLNILLGIEKEFEASTHLGYLRVLGFDDTGRRILKEIKTKSDLTIISNMNHINDALKSNPLLQLDIKASDIYQLGFQNQTQRVAARDLTEPIIIWRKHDEKSFR